MSGAFQTSREIFENPIWKNILEFRLFFLIYGKSVFAEEGYRMDDDLHLQRGEWCRSIRKLQEDLTYIENRQVKTYSTSSLHRATLSLIKAQRICTRKHDLGTVFTVLNYEHYQGFANYKNGNLERNLEQSENSSGTVEEQSGNNNKNVNKEKKVKKVKEEVIKTLYQSNILLSDSEYQKLIEKYGEKTTIDSIQFLESYKIEKDYKTKSDYLTIIRWVVDAVNRDQRTTQPKYLNKSGKTPLRIVDDVPVLQRSAEERAAMRAVARELDADKDIAT